MPGAGGTSDAAGPWIDVAFAFLSVRVEGATVPPIDFPSEAHFAAAIAGHLAAEGRRHCPPGPAPDRPSGRT